MANPAQKIGAKPQTSFTFSHMKIMPTAERSNETTHGTHTGPTPRCAAQTTSGHQCPNSIHTSDTLYGTTGGWVIADGNKVALCGRHAWWMESLK